MEKTWLSYPKNSFNIITAQFSLRFIRPADFKLIFTKIKGCLVPGGIFTGQLFGDRIEWNATSRSMTFLSKEQIQSLLADMEVIEITDEEAAALRVLTDDLP
ncbi:MAG: class I SAM-dependent methyltransferase [Candidatus Acidiferrum sp.]|jgi:hypothetical protein